MCSVKLHIGAYRVAFSSIAASPLGLGSARLGLSMGRPALTALGKAAHGGVVAELDSRYLWGYFPFRTNMSREAWGSPLLHGDTAARISRCLVPTPRAPSQDHGHRANVTAPRPSPRARVRSPRVHPRRWRVLQRGVSPGAVFCVPIRVPRLTVSPGSVFSTSYVTFPARCIALHVHYYLLDLPEYTFSILSPKSDTGKKLCVTAFPPGQNSPA
jgi:hypothetical protein